MNRNRRPDHDATLLTSPTVALYGSQAGALPSPTTIGLRTTYPIRRILTRQLRALAAIGAGFGGRMSARRVPGRGARMHRRVKYEYEMDAFTGDEAVGAVVHAVLREIDRQVGKWGVQSHSQANWYAILGEEFGEVGKAVCEIALNKVTDLTTDDLRDELIHTAAVCIAMAESLRRVGFDGKP